jgi:DeoR/GlpR family transcriptional regulator of sugar metabolism
MLGGEIHEPSLTTGGVLALDMLDFYKVRFDKAFIAARAVSASDGATNHMIDRVSIKKKAISVSVQSILMADASKIGQVSVAQIAPLSAFSYLVTDGSLKETYPSELDKIIQTGVQVILA